MDKIKKRRILSSFGVGIFVFIWMFIGLFEEREFFDIYIFIKHRPTFKFFFYAPRHEMSPSNTPGKEGYLTPEKENEEKAYIDFIETHGGYGRSIFIPIPYGVFSKYFR